MTTTYVEAEMVINSEAGLPMRAAVAMTYVRQRPHHGMPNDG